MPSLDAISGWESAVLASVRGATGTIEDRDRQITRAGLYAEYPAIVRSYLELVPDERDGVEALKRAHEAVAQRDYRQALNNALDARERAQVAAKETVNRKATARADATKALADADAALHDSRAKLKAAETAHIAARTLANGRKAIDNGESAVQEARTAFEKGDYLGAIQTASSVAGHLGPAIRDLDVAAPAGVRRRH